MYTCGGIRMRYEVSSFHPASWSSLGSLVQLEAVLSMPRLGEEMHIDRCTLCKDGRRPKRRMMIKCK
jgi:hypothetical protein